MSEYLNDFKVLPKKQLPSGAQFGVSFTTVTVNAPKNISYLYDRLKRTYGVRFVRQRIPSLHAAFTSPTTKVAFNCIGNAARTFPGVEDSRCFPTRGQVVLVKAPHVFSNIMRHGNGYETYVIPRPESNGYVTLGGYMQKNVEDASTYSYETESILTRTRDLSHELRVSDFEVLGVFSGMRPSREGGARIERDELAMHGERKVVVHNYGAGGTGFQAGYGMAMEAVGAVHDILGTIDKTEIQARL
ncbi:hypothetical protein FE257_003053 [Aspergillus nanangensis]|uniref:FAD dependent oxidoreductase domain-containing protein n=1 Tax=Aspergillus nanangensis TaxID=2582783 RepID=A0AAD4CBZ9_ASPNN|nr:hypothetical protein FE257_003053 [Aspergillus nanangensis]